MHLPVEHEKELTPDSIILFSHGGINVDGEWHGSSNKYSYLARGCYGLNHNYQIELYRGTKNTWFISIFLCLTACNGASIGIFNDQVKTMKGAKARAAEIISKYDKSPEAAKAIELWCEKHARPVFIIDQDIPKHVGTTYRSLLADIRDSQDEITKNRWLYFYKDLPDYCAGCAFYSLERKTWEKGQLYIYEVTRGWGVYSSGGIEDGGLLQKMICLIRNDNKYKALFSPIVD